MESRVFLGYISFNGTGFLNLLVVCVVLIAVYLSVILGRCLLLDNLIERVASFSLPRLICIVY